VITICSICYNPTKVFILYLRYLYDDRNKELLVLSILKLLVFLTDTQCISRGQDKVKLPLFLLIKPVDVETHVSFTSSLDEGE
jgi:hypothetical protein